MKYIYSLSEINNSMKDMVGSKAANLGELKQANYNVPNGYVITINAFNLFLSTNQILKNLPDKEISIKNLSFPTEIKSELSALEEFISQNTLAVRSSAVEEDLPNRSYAGLYNTVLGVTGFEELQSAIIECWLSTFDNKVLQYRDSNLASKNEIGVIIQKLIDAESAGVAFSINPTNGNRDEVVISAVKGLGEKLVSGMSTTDEWVVRGNKIVENKIVERSLNNKQIRELAKITRSIENKFDTPQDIEWAYQDNELFILQSRPVSVIFDDIEWKAPESGLWLRNFRLGEWLDNPVTPLFASWLVPKLDNQLYSNLEKETNIPTPKPYHVIINGWYFATGNFLPKNPLDAVWKLFRYILPALIFKTRRIAILIPRISYWGIKLYEEEWRNEILPKYVDLIETSKRSIANYSPTELFDLLEEITTNVGWYYYSLIAVAGSAWKPEFKFANFYEKKIGSFIEHGYQILLQGLGTATSEPYEHAVTNLDWYHPTLGELIDEDKISYSDNSDVVNRRRDLREEINAHLKTNPKLLRKFNQLLDEAQEVAMLREEQIYKFTLAWPLMREILDILGKIFTEQGNISQPSDIFFLEKEEVLGIVEGTKTDFSKLTTNRRETWKIQCKLQPPLILGKMSFLAKRVFDTYEKSTQINDDKIIVRGLPVSPGVVTGKLRVINSLADADEFQNGEILVTRATNPAWTILFPKAIAVVTDVGSTMAHASLVAREYGIPAVVGTGNGSLILKTGQIVTVNGNTGTLKEVT